MKIAVAGAGYVGLSIATLLSQHHFVTVVDVVQEKVDKINARISPIQDEYIEKYFAEKELHYPLKLSVLDESVNVEKAHIALCYCQMALNYIKAFVGKR